MKICFLIAIICFSHFVGQWSIFSIKECLAILKNDVCGNHVLNEFIFQIFIPQIFLCFFLYLVLTYNPQSLDLIPTD